METRQRPYRSVLYIPASNVRALEKARSLATDAIIFDLEDAVAPNEKDSARATLAEALDTDYGLRTRIVRINGLDTPWGAEDATVMAASAADAILLPKVSGAADLDALAAIVPQPLWAMIESPAGILQAQDIAAHARLQGFVMGTNDLAKDLNCLDQRDRMPLMTALQWSLLAARANGVICVDGVYNAFKDDAGLRSECLQGRALGMDGKSLIHPAQLAIANEVFAPSDEEIDLAQRQIAAYEAALAEGQGIAVLDGQIVENLHVETASGILAKAQAIAELEAAA